MPLTMVTRFNYKPVEKRDSSKDDCFSLWKYQKKIHVLSKNEDGSVDKYTEESFWKEEKSSWSDYMKSFRIGSVQEQVMNHIKKGTPLITAHTLPNMDYTKLQLGAEVKKELEEKGLTVDMIAQSIYEKMKAEEEAKKKEAGEKENPVPREVKEGE